MHAICTYLRLCHSHGCNSEEEHQSTQQGNTEVDVDKVDHIGVELSPIGVCSMNGISFISYCSCDSVHVLDGR